MYTPDELERIIGDSGLTAFVEESTSSEFPITNNINKMYNKAIIGAVVSSIIVAVLTYILSVGDIFTLDWKVIVNVAILTGMTSLLKFLGTNSDGKFLGIAKIK